MVCRFTKTVLFAPELAVRAGVDGIVFDDGGCCLFNLDRKRPGEREKSGVEIIPAAIDAQLSVVRVVFRIALPYFGAIRYCGLVDGDSGHDRDIFPDRQTRGLVDGALFDLGKFCQCAQFLCNGIELLAAAENSVY